MNTYPKPATPLPWKTRLPLDPDDVVYIRYAANAFPHLVAAIEALLHEERSAWTKAKDALRIARGEVAP
jgi:hypothetical protein